MESTGCWTTGPGPGECPTSGTPARSTPCSRGQPGPALIPTGETAVISGTEEGLVLALGTFPVDENAGPNEVYYRGLDQLLSGWADHCTEPNGLAWMIQRIDEAQDGE